MITFITDERAGELVILEPVYKEDLKVVDLEGRLIEVVEAPRKGWTHQVLQSTAERLAVKTSKGAEAYLGDSWVGSTEV